MNASERKKKKKKRNSPSNNLLIQDGLKRWRMAIREIERERRIVLLSLLTVKQKTKREQL